MESKRNYWIHRISYYAEISHPLLEQNYLSYGFSDFEFDGFIEKVRGKDGWDYMEQTFLEYWGELPRNRYQLWHFIQDMKVGDWVIVPTNYEFSICEILEDEPLLVKDIRDVEIRDWNNKLINRDENGYLVDDKGEKIDLGFARRIKMIASGISRYDYADAPLSSRLKIRQTNADVSDLEDSVLKALDNFKNNKAINLKTEISDFIPQLHKKIQTMLTPDKFESLVKLYFEKSGANSAYIPPKNPAGKQGVEDVDVIATFDLLKTIYNVQVKHHSGETDSWATEQISQLQRMNQGDRQDDGYTRVYWVLSSADSFSDACVKMAKEANIQLIDGKMFAAMLLDAGLMNIDCV